MVIVAKGIWIIEVTLHFQLRLVFMYMCVCVCVVCSGGTDIISCFAGQNPTVPVYRGEIQSRNLGMAMECWSMEGESFLVHGD